MSDLSKGTLSLLKSNDSLAQDNATYRSEVILDTLLEILNELKLTNELLKGINS